jgi:adenine-specific DNA-methyltransferase
MEEHFMQNLFEDLKQLLAQDQRLTTADGKLLKNLIVELGLKLDTDLLRLLLSHDRIRQHFFAQVDGVLVFDKEKFLQFVSNKQFLPDSYTAFKNKIGLSDDGGQSYLSRRRDVVLVWPYKDCVLEGGQTEEEAKRDEIFWNTTLAPDDVDRLLDPKVLTNFRRVDAEGKHPVTGLKPADNLIIKGNNLLALHSLVRRFGRKVKLVYIDPPFNTDNDSFQYNDSFSQSTWLTFLKNRLEIARELMAKDGSIFVHIDQDNKHLLKMIMDEIFGRENFRNEIILPGRAVKNLQQQFTSIKRLQVRHDTLFWYTKSPETSIKPYWIEKYDVGNPEGHWHHAWSTAERKTMQYELLGTNIDKGQWVWSEERALKAVENYNRFLEEGGGRTLVEYWRDTGRKLSFIRESPDDGRPQYWRAPADVRLGDTVWTGVPIYSNTHGFKTEKNEKYLAEIINLASEEGDLILDFFVGSGTTAATAHKLNRQWIAVEQMDYVDTITVERLKNVTAGDTTGISRSANWQGGGDFVVCELMQWNERYVQRIQAAASAEELWKLWQEMQKQAFLSYKVDVAAVNEHAGDFADLTLKEQKRFLLETLDHNALYVNLSEIDDTDYGVSEEDKRLNTQFYGQGA